MRVDSVTRLFVRLRAEGYIVFAGYAPSSPLGGATAARYAWAKDPLRLAA